MTEGHASVMLDEVVEMFGHVRSGVIVDGTVGQGGHAEALLARTNTTLLLAMDLDPQAIAASRARLAVYKDRVVFVRRGYDELPEVLKELNLPKASGILIDTGFSSTQLASNRGFSIEGDAYLDMRFDPTSGPTAAEVIRATPEPVLAGWLREFGEFRGAARLAKRLKEEAKRNRMNTMAEFTKVCREVLGPRIRGMPSPILPAQAIRIVTNREIERLDRLLSAVPEVLGPGGRLVVISFHSIEDRRVKRAFSALAGKGFRVVTRRPLRPSQDEVARNRRARSARMRVLDREVA